MKNKEFLRLVEEQFSKCRTILRDKEKIYSIGQDRLARFYTASVLTGLTPVQALLSMMAKHTVTIYDVANRECEDIALWDELITDLINYLLLLRALVEEEYNRQTKERST